MANERSASTDDDTDDQDKCRTCGEPYDGCGDGWDGECPDCADKTYIREGGEIL